MPYDSMTMTVSPGSQVHVLSHLARWMLQDNGHGMIGRDWMRVSHWNASRRPVQDPGLGRLHLLRWKMFLWRTLSPGSLRRSGVARSLRGQGRDGQRKLYFLFINLTFLIRRLLSEDLLTRARTLQSRQNRHSIVPSTPGSRSRSRSLVQIPRLSDFQCSHSTAKILKLAGPLTIDSVMSSGDQRPGLPLPPRELLEKQRGPIATPARMPMVKPVHPKELVHLHPAPQVKPSAIPRSVHPKQLVRLRAVQPPSSSKRNAVRMYPPRRSSGESVKDLIQCFEDQGTRKQGGFDGRRTAEPSVNGVRRRHGNVSRPVWRL